MPAIEPNHAMPAFESATSARPMTIERRLPIRSIASPANRTSPYMPDDVDADDREDASLRVVVADGHVAREVHHARHHGEAADGRHHRGRDAGPAEDLGERTRLGRRDERL